MHAVMTDHVVSSTSLPVMATSSVFVKNTFISVVDDVQVGDHEKSIGSGSMRRSASESDLDKTSSGSVSSDATKESGNQKFHKLWGPVSKSSPSSSNSSFSGKGSDDRKFSGREGRYQKFPEFSEDVPRMYQECTKVWSTICQEDAQNDSKGVAFEFATIDEKGSDNHYENLSKEELVMSAHQESGVGLETLEKLWERGVLQKIPRYEGQLTSIGSIHHRIDGPCRPCIFWFKGICVKKLQCTFCHLMHDGQKSKRIKPSKRTRMQMKAAETRTIRTDQMANDQAADVAVFPQSGVFQSGTRISL